MIGAVPLDLILIKAPLALAPALLLLFALDRLDGFDIVSDVELFRLLLGGAALSVVAYFLNGRSLDALPIAFTDYSRFAAPFLEEALKAGFIVGLFLRSRIGFRVDAAICGAAVGTGFAVFENAYYLWGASGANVGVWIVRGFGTSLMHGGACAIFAIVSQSLMERTGRLSALRFLPGFLAATALHAAFNQFPDRPIIALLGALLLIPLSLVLVMYRGEQAAHAWLAADREQREQRLRAIGRQGARPDISAYVSLHESLVDQAEALFLAREAGEHPCPPPDLAERLEELDRLRRKLSCAARASIDSQLHFSHRELWALHELESLAKPSLAGRLRRRSSRKVPTGAETGAADSP